MDTTILILVVWCLALSIGMGLMLWIWSGKVKQAGVLQVLINQLELDVFQLRKENEIQALPTSELIDRFTRLVRERRASAGLPNSPTDTDPSKS